MLIMISISIKKTLLSEFFHITQNSYLNFRYEGHALSRKAVDRIFEQHPRRFQSGQNEKMSYEDFICNY